MSTDRGRRLAERADADRRYNDALTALDRALPPQPAGLRTPEDVPGAVPAALSGRSIILPEEPPGGRGLRGRLSRFVWGIAGPVFTRQQAFNQALAARVEATEEALRDLARRAREQDEAMGREAGALRTFESRLVQFLQQITPFVETKVRAIEGEIDDLRMTAASAHRAALAAQRQLADRERASGSAGPPPVRQDTPSGAPGAASYVGFEDLYRGSTDAVRSRQAADADRLAGASDVLDVGCGRGEFLELLRERGVSARGIDLNPEMVDACRARGLDASHADALGYLERLPEGSLGGLVAAQVVEHLDPGYLVRFLAAAHARLRPGAPILLETINVACWVAFFESYVRDITHVRPLHPDTLKYLVVAAGFEDVDVHFRSPVEPAGRLQRIPEEGLPPELAAAVRTINGNVDRLNERIFTYLDYAVIGVRGR